MITPPPANKIPVKVPDNLVVTIPEVPFFSQFKDITSTKWKKVGCGIASLAMILDYYKTEEISVNKLLDQGISIGAYQEKNGWTHSGLISISKKYGMSGNSYDYSGSSKKIALEKFNTYLKDGPVMASVHYKFDPKNPIPHIVVIDAIDKDMVYYNDPASDVGQKKISLEKFLASWKNRFIVIRPNTKKVA